MANEIIMDVALEDNTEERVPLVLCLDCSGSMGGAPIDALNQGLQALKSELQNDPIASKRVRVLIIAFGMEVQKIGDWTDLMDFEPPVLTPNGPTPTGEAVKAALQAIEDEKKRLRAAGVSYKRPWLFLMSDGSPTDQWESAAKAAVAAEKDNKVTIFPIGVGDADLDTLGRFSNRAAIRLQGLKFKELFVWMSASVRTASVSVQGEKVALASPAGWADLEV